MRPGRVRDPTYTNSPLRAELEPLVQAALAAVKALIERYPDDARAVDLAADLHYRLGDMERARRHWERCIELEPRYVPAHVALGRLFLQSGEFAQAERVLRPAVAQAPTDAQAAFLLASAISCQGKSAEAIQVLETAVAAQPGFMPSQFLLGQLLLQSNENQKAKQCFRAAVGQAPEYANAYFGLATACARLGQKDEAARCRAKFKELQAKELRAGIEQTEQYDDLGATRRSLAETYYAVGRAYLAHDDASAAEQHWRRAAELDPQDADSRLELAGLCEQQGRIGEAIEWLGQLTQLRGENPGLWLRRGQLHVQVQQWEAAERDFRRVVALAPQRAVGYAALADLGLRSGDLKQALAAVEQALRLEPGNAQFRQMYLSIRPQVPPEGAADRKMRAEP